MGAVITLRPSVVSFICYSVCKEKKTKKVIKGEGENKQNLDSFFHLQDKMHTLLRSIHPSIFYHHVSCTQGSAGPGAHPRQGTPWTSGQSVTGLAGTNKLTNCTQARLWLKRMQLIISCLTIHVRHETINLSLSSFFFSVFN